METIHLLQSVANPALDALTLALTHLGSENAYIVMLLVTYLSIDARVGRLLGIAVLGSYYLNDVAKTLFDTPRPYRLHPELLRSEAAGATAPGPAFPSGHAQLSATFWGLAAALARRWWFGLSALVLVLLVSLTRIYLGVHWPIDVIAGIAFGFVIACAALAAFAWRPTIPAPALAAGWLLVPLALHLAWRTPESGLIAGALAGFATGGMVVPHRPPRDLGRRVLLAVLGLALVFAWLFGTSALLPEAVKDHVLVEPARYFVLTWMGVVVAPWLYRRSLPASRTV